MYIRLRHHAVQATVGALLGLGSASSSASPPNSVELQLLESSRYWQMQGRVDLARQPVEKLLQARRGDPALLYRLGEIDLALDPEHCHIPVERLRLSAPDDYRAEALAAECFAATTGRLKLARVMQLRDLNRHQEAAVELKKIFSSGPPLSRTGILYYQILEAAGYPYEEIRRGLKALAERFPQDNEIQLAYSTLLARNPGSARSAISRARSDVQHMERRDQALQLWRTALEQLTAAPDVLRLYRDYLKEDPNNDRVLSAQRSVLRDEARGKAAALVARGSANAAIRYLEAALAVDPERVWLRYDLAELYRVQGQPDQAKRLMLKGSALAPRDNDMRYAAALILDRLGDEAAALAQLESLSAKQLTDSMQELRSQLAFTQCMRDALNPQAVNPSNQLLRCERFAQSQTERRLQLARAWRTIDPATGSRRLKAWLALQDQPPPTLVLERLRLLRAAGLVEELDDAFAAALRATRGTPEYAAVFAEKRAYLMDRVDDQAEQKTPGEKLDLLRQAASLGDADEPALLFAVAELQQELGQNDQALSNYARALEQEPGRPWQRLTYAQLLAEMGQERQASEQIKRVLAYKPMDENLMYVSFLRLRGVVDTSTTRQELRRALDEYPEYSRLWLLAGDLALQQKQRDNAENAYASGLATTPDSQTALRDEFVERLKPIQAKNNGQIGLGWDAVRKPGTPGISQLKLDTYSLEWRQSLDWGQQWAVQLDRIRVDSGSLQLTDQEEFGQFATLSPEQREALPASPDGAAHGLAVAGLFASSNWLLDLGVLSLGDGSERLIGGLRFRHDWAQQILSAQLAQRPVSSTRLSFAGATDPVSGRHWGAVQRLELGLGIARYEHAYDYSMSLRAESYRGENTQSNSSLRLRLAGALELWHHPHAHLSLSMAAAYWRYRHNQSFHTFGHGGYYSPQRYLSVRTNLDLRGLIRRWSYLVQVGLGDSKSSDKDAPFYPQDPELQAAATQQASINGSDAPIYSGGSGGGSGVSMQLAIEYALSQRWAIGAHYALDRSDFYEPDFMGFYLRRELGSPRQLPEAPPRAPLPLAEY